MNTRAEHLIIFSLLTPFIFVIALMMHQWNIIGVQMIEMNMNTNDASLELNRVMLCGSSVGVSDVDVASASMMELNRRVDGGSVDVSDVDVASASMMEPTRALMCGRW